MTCVDRRTFCALTVPSLAWRPEGRQTPVVRAPAQPRGSPFDIPDTQALNRIRDVMEVSGTPGIGVVLVQEGRVTWAEHLGMSDATTRAAVTADTLWPAASLGKPVMALAALSLVSDKALDLDRPMRDYLPDHTSNNDLARRITARHVLSHSSGLPNWRTRPDQPLTPQFEPGARFQYSGEGYYYVQCVIEAIVGMGFEQFMRERVFGPLGMTHSTYAWRADMSSRIVTGHDRGAPQPSTIEEFSNRLLEYAEARGRSLAGFRHEDRMQAMQRIPGARALLPVFTLPNAAASLITTPIEYSRFLVAVMDPEASAIPLLPALRQEMFTAQTPLNRALAWGLGWGLEYLTPAGLTAPRFPPDYVWHWGDNGNWKNFVLSHPGSQSALAIFANGNRGLNVAQRVIATATGEDHPAFQWL